MREQWMDRFTARISDFEEKLEAFNKGEIDRKAYKGFSGGFGSYAQRDRLRTCCGSGFRAAG